MKAAKRYSAAEVLEFLRQHENPGGKAVLVRHGARDPFFGTRIGDMKKLTAKIKKDHELSLALYETGNSDAMYFAALIADETLITRETLRRWVKRAYWYLLSESAVAPIAAETRYGFELAQEWIEAPEEMIAAAGWATWSSLLSIRPNEAIDDRQIEALIARVEREIHGERNRVKYCMNNFVISVGAYLPHLTDRAKSAGKKIGRVSVDVGGTGCKVPVIAPYIEKIEARGTIGKKRKKARC